jgi:hypothetical protein
MGGFLSAVLLVFLLPFRSPRHDQVVAMNHSGPPGVAEDGLNVRRLASGDTSCLVGVISGEPAGDLVSISIDDGYGIAAVEVTGYGDNAGGKQAFAFGERTFGPSIDGKFTCRL